MKKILFKRCGNCEYYEHEITLNQVTCQGVCLRYPPIPMIINGELQSVFPIVIAYYENCLGEWKLRKRKGYPKCKHCNKENK